MKFTTLASLMATAYAADCVNQKVTDAQKELDTLTKERDDLVKELETVTDQTKSDRLAALKDGDNSLIKQKEGDLQIAKNGCVSTDAGGDDDTPVQNDDDTPVPVEVDSANSAVTKAAQEITTFDSQIELAEKLAAKYNDMDEVAKQTFDAKLKLKAKGRADFLDAEKLEIGFAKLTAAQQEQYLLKYDEWRKAFQDKCDKAKQAGTTDAECEHGEALRKAQVKKQVTDKYYEKSAADQKLDDSAYVTQKKQDLAGIEAAAKPAVTTNGKTVSAGAKCDKDSSGKRPACPSGHCCGRASEKKEGDTAGDILGGIGSLVKILPAGDDICHTSTSSLYEKTVDGSKKQYNFKCITGATQLAATVLSVAAATFMMA